MRILWTALVSPERTRAPSSCSRATFSARWVRTTSTAVPCPWPVIAPSSGRGSAGERLEADPGLLQPVEQRIAHGLGRRDLPGRRGVVVEDEAHRGLGQHLGGLGVARVTTGDAGADRLLAGLAGLAEEVDGEPRRCALGVVGPG